MADKKSDYKLRLREEARQKVRPAARAGSKGYSEAISKARKELLQKAAEGGDSRVKRIKAELFFLLNNYDSVNDVRIEALIDEWRRSGDREYDPEIRTRLRRARKDRMRDTFAL